MEMFRKTYAEISLANLEFNLKAIKKNFPDSFLCPMVKANAYGHGDVRVAKALENSGVKNLGVCLIEEGLLLRNFGVNANILVFRGFDREGARKILQYNMTPVVSGWHHLEHLDAVADSQVNVHVKFDTGMNRLGYPVKDAPKLLEFFQKNKKFKVQAVVTHLSEGEDGYFDTGNTVEQLRKISEAYEIFKPLTNTVHALNSAGILSAIKVREDKRGEHPLFKTHWGVRPGLMLYGYNPIKTDFALSLKPVMSLKSHVGVFRNIQKGEGVSYNSTWRAPRESVIAVVPIGYADGYHRILSNKSEVLFLNQRVPVVGNICMDYLMLDVTEVAKTTSFDPHKEYEVVFFGSSANGNFISAHEVAKIGHTIPWEILTSVGERVPRIYTGEFFKGAS
jgi:alanine racemase